LNDNLNSFIQPSFPKNMNSKLRSSLAIVSAMGLLATLTGCQTPATKTSAATPCMDVLPLFTAADVPAFAPSEIAYSEKYANGITRSGLPGNGLAQHPMLYVGENYNKMFLVNDGNVIWTYSTGPGPEFDDVWMLSNGNMYGLHCRDHPGQASGVAVRLPCSQRCPAYGNPRLPADWIGIKSCSLKMACRPG
jgi:hypothetical protein